MSDSKASLNEWILRTSLAGLIFFGGKWVGNVDKAAEGIGKQEDRLIKVEEKLNTVDKIEKIQSVMLINQLEMNKFIADQYGNKALAAKFDKQLETIKDDKEDQRLKDEAAK